MFSFKNIENQPLEITEERKKELIEKIAKKVVDMRLTVPAIVFLESMKPLSFIGSQAMVFFEPFFKSIFSFKEYDEIASMLEERENVERLLCEIERIDAEKG